MSKEVDGILVAAHELKAPLTTLRQLALSLENLTPPDQKIQSQILRISDRAIAEINQLAKIRQLKDGLFPMEPVAVREVCDSVTAELRRLFRDQNLTLATDYHNRSPLVSANRELLHHVIYNFGLNALHYARYENDHTATRETDNEADNKHNDPKIDRASNPKTTSAHTRLTVREIKNRVRVEIRDFGPALPTKIWRALKTDSLEAPTSIAMRPASSALGLYLASRFSRHMHADIGAVRHRDGTTFFVDLPISKQASLFS